jgi:hypothetical protein
MAKLYHPELDVTIERPESSVPVHMVSGWLPVEDRPQAAASRSMTEPPDSAEVGTSSEEPEKKPEKSAARTRRSSTTSEESTDGGA